MLIKLNIEKNLVEIWNTVLVIFDVEGVLLDEEYLPILAEKLNKEDEIWEITKQGIQGKINWEEGLRTGHQAKTPTNINVKCWTIWTLWFCKAKSYKGGKCQPTKNPLKVMKQIMGLVILLNNAINLGPDNIRTSVT